MLGHVRNQSELKGYMEMRNTKLLIPSPQSSTSRSFFSPATFSKAVIAHGLPQLTELPTPLFVFISLFCLECSGARSDDISRAMQLTPVFNQSFSPQRRPTSAIWKTRVGGSGGRVVLDFEIPDRATRMSDPTQLSVD